MTVKNKQTLQQQINEIKEIKDSLHQLSLLLKPAPVISPPTVFLSKDTCDAIESCLEQISEQKKGIFSNTPTLAAELAKRALDEFRLFIKSK